MDQERKTSVLPEEPKARPVILTFTASYLPGYRGGGPIRSIVNMVERLSDDFVFRIVTLDRDLHDQHAYQNVEVDAWNTVGKAQVFYVSPSMRTLWGMTRLLRETRYDILYLNSFFDTAFTLCPLIARRLRLAPYRPTILAPRGEFSAGAFELKRWKKEPFVKLARLIGLYRGIWWHASTELEVTDIKRVFPEKHSAIYTASNVAVAPDLLERSTAGRGLDCEHIVKDDSMLRVCFLSRISPKKNLDFALRVLACVGVPVEFSIYGPQENLAYWQECLELIAQLPGNIKVRYYGSIPHDQVRTTIAQHDLFFLPTRGENFGHVFLEAWSASTPVLISDQTPWLGLEQQHLGWDISLGDFDGFVTALEAAAKMNKEQRVHIGRHCFEFALEKAEDSVSLQLNRNLFLSAVANDSVNPNTNQ